jgi:hypothetical protein
MRVRAGIALVLGLTASGAAAQGGYTKEKYPDLGIELERPRDYEQIPTQPDEEFVVLYFAEKLPKDPKDRPPIRTELWVLAIDYVPDPPPKDAPEEAPAPEESEGEGEGEAAPIEVPLPVNSLERWLEQHSPWELRRAQETKPRAGWKVRSHTLSARKGADGSDVVWSYAFEQPGVRTVAFVARCAESAFKDQERIWRRMAETCDLSAPAEADVAKLRQKYARSDLRGIDYRIGVRARMVRGWKAEDTENFIVVYHTKDQPLIRNLVADIESIRHEYVRLFPPAGEITAVSTVRVCKDQAEYLAYGGMRGSAGYWNSATEELVFYDASVKEKGKAQSDDSNTFIVLYHEAFHQYIHYSAGELPPHPWFNEGHGDFFSGADVHGTKVRRIGVNPWRLGTIQVAIARQKTVPWKDILEYEQPQYYANPALCYAQGWSMVYFLRTAPAATRHPQWSRILDTYFAELKSDYARRLGELAAQGRQDDRAERRTAGAAARKHALERSFESVDLAELEAEWAKYIAKLERPR